MGRQVGRIAFPVLLLAFSFAAVGCKDHTKLEGTPVELNVDGRTITLQMGDCRVYKVERNWFGSVRNQTRVLSADFYLGFTVCTRQSLRKDGDYAIATLCRQAVGAGGGCASSGTYRSRDGDKWEKAIEDKWVPVDSVDVPPASDASPPGKAVPEKH
jgi:hypothetical protein